MIAESIIACGILSLPKGRAPFIILPDDLYRLLLGADSCTIDVDLTQVYDLGYLADGKIAISFSNDVNIVGSFPAETLYGFVDASRHFRKLIVTPASKFLRDYKFISIANIYVAGVEIKI